MVAQARKTVDPRWLAVLGIPLLFLLVLTALKIHFGLNLADEGFLWYGAQRTFAGDVPIRDFQAYDPGRYYWTALWMWLAGDDGIIVTRWAAVLFEALAVAVTAGAVWRQTRSAIVAVLASGSCILLMHNLWHARYEPAAALLQVVALAWLIERRADLQFFLGGLQAGLAAFVGRNVALYGAVGLVAVVASIAFMERRAVSRRRLLLIAGGGLAGALPLLAMLLFVPGFETAFWQSILRHFELGTTNISLPIPWPWVLPYAGPWSIQVAELFYGVFHLLLPVFGGAVVAWWLLRDRRLPAEHPVFMAAALLSLPYAHYAFSRASMEHLVRAGAPLMLALAVLPVRRARWRFVPALLLAAVLAFISPLDLHGVRVVGGSPALSPLHWLDGRKNCRETTVGRDRLCVPDFTAQTVEGARALVNRFVRPGESALVVPFHAGLYPALGLKAPTWEIYPLFPATPAFEVDEIERIEKARTRLVIFSTFALDDRPDLHYSVTHPLITAYLSRSFSIVPQAALPAGVIAAARP